MSKTKSIDKMLSLQRFIIFKNKTIKISQFYKSLFIPKYKVLLIQITNYDIATR